VTPCAEIFNNLFIEPLSVGGIPYLTGFGGGGLWGAASYTCYPFQAVFEMGVTGIPSQCG
jgi:hypothetical protein